MMQEGQTTMTSQPTPTEAAPQGNGILTFTTRFGQVEVHEDRLLSFPQGLFGFRECTSFGLAKLPNVENTPLLLLQCVNQPAIAFLVSDPAALGLEIAEEDRAEALRETRMDASQTQFLTIITLYDNGDSYYLTANLKAPILVDSNSRGGVQFILSNKTYSTQQKI